MRVLKIIDGTSVDGPGLRTSIYFAGCSHHCHGCHNPQSWDPASGEEVDIEAILGRIEENDFDVTFSGGDPLYQVEKLTELAKRIKMCVRNIWCYTGYSFEEITNDPKLSAILPYIDVLVDSKFNLDLRDISLRFRGSSNQRIIDVKKSKPGQIVLWQD